MGRNLPKLTLGLAFLLTTLAAGAETCFVSVAHAQGPQQQTVAISVDTIAVNMDTMLTLNQLAQMDGVTFCLGNRVFTRMDPQLDSIPFRSVAAHEAKHREQFKRFKSCEAWDADYRTPTGRLNSEAEAYAAGYCEAKRLGWEDMETLENNILQIIYARVLGGGTPIYEVAQTFKKYVDC